MVYVLPILTVLGGGVADFQGFNGCPCRDVQSSLWVQPQNSLGCRENFSPVQLSVAGVSPPSALRQGVGHSVLSCTKCLALAAGAFLNSITESDAPL